MYTELRGIEGGGIDSTSAWVIIRSLVSQDYEYEDDFDEVLEEEETASSENEEEGRSDTPTGGRDSQTTTNARGHSQQAERQSVDLLAIMEAVDAENMAVETTSETNIVEPSFENVDGTVIVKFAPKESEGEEEDSEGGNKIQDRGEPGKLLQSPSRKFVDFSSVQKNEAALKVAKKTRKRAQVKTTLFDPISSPCGLSTSRSEFSIPSPLPSPPPPTPPPTIIIIWSTCGCIVHVQHTSSILQCNLDPRQALAGLLSRPFLTSYCSHENGVTYPGSRVPGVATFFNVGMGWGTGML